MIFSSVSYTGVRNSCSVRNSHSVRNSWELLGIWEWRTPYFQRSPVLLCDGDIRLKILWKFISSSTFFDYKLFSCTKIKNNKKSFLTLLVAFLSPHLTKESISDHALPCDFLLYSISHNSLHSLCWCILYTALKMVKTVRVHRI